MVRARMVRIALAATVVLLMTTGAARAVDCRHPNIPSFSSIKDVNVPLGTGTYEVLYKGGPFKTRWRVFVDPGFSEVRYGGHPSQREVIDRAVKFGLEKLFTGTTWTCAEIAASKDTPKPTVGEFDKWLYNQLRSEEVIKDLYIGRFYVDNDRNGELRGCGEVEFYNDNNGKFFISLNSNNVTIPGEPWGDSSYKVWGATIVHEMLHNLGFRHGDYTAPDYFSYWVTAFAKCVEAGK